MPPPPSPSPTVLSSAALLYTLALALGVGLGLGLTTKPALPRAPHIIAPSPDAPPSSSSAWTSCRASAVHTPAALSAALWRGVDGACMPAAVPGTALGALIANRTFGIRDPYVDDALQTLPDIAVTGPAFYTFVTRSTVRSADIAGCGGALGPRARVVLAVQQLSYRAALHVDGAAAALAPVGAPEAVGMWRRWQWDLGSAAEWCAVPQHGLAFLVSPPDHPGNTSSTCRVCGQGGNHAIAQDLVSQDTCGWDWVGGIADRNTGILDMDSPLPRVIPSGIVLGDPAVAVSALELPSGFCPARATSLSASVTLSVACVRDAPVEGTLTVSIPSAGFLRSVDAVCGPAAAPLDVTLSQEGLTDVALWWPHTHGVPALHDATAVFSPRDGGAPATFSWRASFRTVDSALEVRLGGRSFTVNRQRIFFTGGNYIDSDALSRAEYRTPQRCADEVRQHVWAGMNLVRLWGGHGGTPLAMWDEADKQGLMLWHEFWQTGDNNGRWAGNYSWPLDHAGYLGAAADTIRSIRGHASLLLYVGGNEIYPLKALWAPPLLQQLVLELDPRGSPFLHSSMGSGPEGARKDPWADFYNSLGRVTSGKVFIPFDPIKTLAPTDGNYGINDERQYAGRNPGLNNAQNLLLAFQPEIGNTVSCLKLPFLPSTFLHTSSAPRFTCSTPTHSHPTPP